MKKHIFTLLILLTGCVVGQLPTPEPTITLPAATLWPTNTPSPTATLTAVNISPEPTPTLEVWVRCVPNSYAYLDDYTLLYDDEELTEFSLTENGIVPEVWKDQPVYLIRRGQRQAVWEVVTATNVVMQGYVSVDKLPVECR